EKTHGDALSLVAEEVRLDVVARLDVDTRSRCCRYVQVDVEHALDNAVGVAGDEAAQSLVTRKAVVDDALCAQRADTALHIDLIPFGGPLQAVDPGCESWSPHHAGGHRIRHLRFQVLFAATERG